MKRQATKLTRHKKPKELTFGKEKRNASPGGKKKTDNTVKAPEKSLKRLVNIIMEVGD